MSIINSKCILVNNHFTWYNVHKHYILVIISYKILFIGLYLNIFVITFNITFSLFYEILL